MAVLDFGLTEVSGSGVSNLPKVSDTASGEPE